MRLRFLLLLAGFAAVAPAWAAPFQIKGSATATAPFLAAQAALREAGLPIAVDTDATSSTAVAAVGDKSADVGVITRPITVEERANWPEQRMEQRTLAAQVLTLAVSKDVWAAGVRALDREQVRRIYEKQVTNWKELGGPDHVINFFNPEQGHGIWELLVTWLYGDVRLAPLGDGFEVARGGAETRDAVEFHAGAISVIAPLWPDGRGTFALSIRTDAGELLPATVESVQTKSYPLARRLAAVTAGRPSGDLKKLLDFFGTPPGEEFLKKSDFLPLGPAPDPVR